MQLIDLLRVHFTPLFYYVTFYYDLLPGELLPLLYRVHWKQAWYSGEYAWRTFGTVWFAIEGSILIVFLLTLKLLLLKYKAVVIGIIFVWHRNLYLLQNAKHVVSLQKFVLDVLQNTENKFVKELPFVNKKLVEELSGYMA